MYPIYIYTHTHVYTSIYTRMCIHLLILYIYMNIHINIYIYIYNMCLFRRKYPKALTTARLRILLASVLRFPASAHCMHLGCFSKTQLHRTSRSTDSCQIPACFVHLHGRSCTVLLLGPWVEHKIRTLRSARRSDG